MGFFLVLLNLPKQLFVSYGINDIGLIKQLKLTVTFIWEMHNYLDTNYYFHAKSSEYGSLSHNFYSTANLGYFVWSLFSSFVIKNISFFKIP